MNCPNLSPKLLVLCWLVASAGVICAQPIDLLWSQRIDTSVYNNRPNVVERDSGGFAFAYETFSLERGDYQICFVLTDTLGNIEQEHTFGGVENEMLVGGLTKASDGGYLLSASTGSYGTTNQYWSGWLIKTDAVGDCTWSKVFNAEREDRILRTSVEANGSIFTLIRHAYPPLGNDIIKLTSTGDSITSRFFGDYYLGDGSVYDTLVEPFIRSLTKTSDEDIICFGNAYAIWWIDTANGSAGDEQPILAMKIDNDLNVIYNKLYRDTLSPFYSCPVIETPDHNFYLTAGVNYYNLYDGDTKVMLIDANGELLWSRVYGNEWLSYPTSAAPTSDGGLLLAGQLNHDGENPVRNWLCKISSTGDSLWSMEFGDAIEYRQQAITQTNDSGYVLVSRRWDLQGDTWFRTIEAFRFSPEDLSPVDGRPIGVPQRITLNAFPNPFNAVTTLSVELPQAGDATINVYDVQGRLVRTLVNDYLMPGSHRFSFNGSDIGSGTYFVRLDANKTQNVKKMVLVK